MGAICNAVCSRSEPRNGTHCVVFTLDLQPPLRMGRGVSLQVKGIRAAPMGTSLLQYTDRGSFDRRLLREMASSVQVDCDDPAYWHLFSIIELTHQSRRKVAMGVTHSIDRRYTAWCANWKQTAITLLNGHPKTTAVTKHFAQICASIYAEFAGRLVS